MSKDLFSKGDFQKIQPNFIAEGKIVLQAIADFQAKIKSPDIDTTINGIRDAIIAELLGFDLLNNDKHGFDAKKINPPNPDPTKSSEIFLEIKQCSASSKSWQGVWNDTSEEKAKLFSEENVYTAVAVWGAANELLFIVRGTSPELGEKLLKKIQTRKNGTRSTQSVSISTLIRKMGFQVLCPPEKKPEEVRKTLTKKYANLSKHVKIDNIQQL